MDILFEISYNVIKYNKSGVMYYGER